MTLSTDWSRQLGLRVPIVNAPMGGAAGGRLAAAVTAAGGLGMVGMGSAATASVLRAELDALGGTGVFGVGLVHWVMADRPDLFETALAARPGLVSVSFGDEWSWVPRVHDAGAVAVTQVADVAAARRAVDAGVDVLVARGLEGGGHGEPRIGTLPLLAEVLDVVDVPVLAAGGIASPRALAAVLAAMEVSLSFDNAVVNAGVLKTMNHFWRMMFLTVGILVAVFGMRLVFPIVIVSVAADIGMVDVVKMALSQPDEYAARLTAHHAEVSAFGGMFLMLVFLSFIFDAEKDIHWLHWIEEKLAALGKVDAVAIFVALVALLLSLSLVHEHETFKVLMAGVWGIVVFLGVNVLSAFLEDEEEHDPAVGELVKKGSIGGFLYLEVLDASFSFDGVIGAFAITNDVIIIMLGLTIGAMFVRSMTIFLVEKGTLDAYIFLEHGAHYAIGALSVIMLLSLKYEVPELVTGLIGVAFIGWSVLSSIRHRKAQAAG